MTQRGLPVLAAVALALTVACVPGPWQQQEARPEIAIAALLPFFEDASANMGGVQFALDRNPAMQGYRVRGAFLDDSAGGVLDPSKGLQNLKQVIADPAVLGIVEPSISPEVENSLPLTNSAGLPLLSPATNECLTVALTFCGMPPLPHPTGPTFFRVATPDRMQPLAMAHYARESLGLRRVAAVSDNNDYGNRLADGFSQEFTALGGSVLRDSFVSTDSDFAPLLHRLRDSGLEAIYVGGTSASYTCRMRAQMRAIFATDIYFLGGDGIMDQDCVKDAGSNAGERMIATTPAPQTRVSPEAKAIVNAYRKAHPRPQDVGPYTFAEYDCAIILIDAIGRAIKNNGGRLPNRAQVRQAVSQTRGLKGVTGVWSFDQNGDAANPLVALYQVRNGAWTPLTQVTVKGG